MLSITRVTHNTHNTHNRQTNKCGPWPGHGKPGRNKHTSHTSHTPHTSHTSTPRTSHTSHTSQTHITHNTHNGQTCDTSKNMRYELLHHAPRWFWFRLWSLTRRGSRAVSDPSLYCCRNGSCNRGECWMNLTTHDIMNFFHFSKQ